MITKYYKFPASPNYFCGHVTYTVLGSIGLVLVVEARLELFYSPSLQHTVQLNLPMITNKVRHHRN